MKIAFALCMLVSLFSGVTSAQEGPRQVALWENGAPGFEDRRDEPELAKDWWVKNIHNPSITVYLPPADKATGAAVVIAPGGGFRELVFNPEGHDAAVFLNSIGVAAFALKYRLFEEESSSYTSEHAKQDAYRAMRLVRSRAAEWGVDPNRIGFMGFSAGGILAAFIAYPSGAGDPAAADPVDRLNGKPDFQILIYPGPYGIPDVLPDDAPPAFLLAAIDDPCCSRATIEILQKYHAAGIAAEAHIFAQGNHAFNMGNRSHLKTISTWPQRLADWMADSGLLKPAPPAGTSGD